MFLVPGKMYRPKLNEPKLNEWLRSRQLSDGRVELWRRNVFVFNWLTNENIVDNKFKFGMFVKNIAGISHRHGQICHDVIFLFDKNLHLSKNEFFSWDTLLEEVKE